MKTLDGMTILFAGSGAFGVPTLRRLVEAGATVAGVYTQPSKPAGRGRKLTPTPIAQAAVELGLNVIETPDINAESLPPADALVVIAFGQKLAPSIVDHARLGAINLHASRLPKYRGAAPIHWAVINGDATTGNSVIRLAQRMDAGAVLAMSETPIGPMETTGELHDRLSLDGAPLVERVLCELRDGIAKPIEQDESRATKAPKLSREKSAIDWSRPAEAIARQIVGMQPWPGCRVRVVNSDGIELKKLTLLRARRSSNAVDRRDATPGSITIFGHVACGDGVLEVVESQEDGKRPQSGLCASVPGTRLESI